MVKLWPHQTDVLPQLVLGHWMLAWAPGTGKTPVLLVAGAIVGGRQLWVTHAVLIPQLLSEIARWRPGARVQRFRETHAHVEIRDDTDIVIVSYDLMRRLPVWRKLFAVRWDSAVFDEAHALAHDKAIRTQAVYGKLPTSPGALWRRCDRVWLATGTPIMNAPDDLWTHLSRLFPHVLPMTRKADFLEHFCILARKPFGTVVVGGRNLPELGRILQSCASRLSLDDVVDDLPRLLVDTVAISLTKAQLAEIEAQATPEQLRELHVVVTQIEGGVEAAWQRLQALLLPLASMRRVTALAKAEAAAALVLTDLAGGVDRVVLFGLHVDALRYIALKTAAYNPALLIGETTPLQREQRIADFTAGRSRVLIASIRIAGQGLNLQAANRCYFLETDWTPSAFDQAVARLYRAGQKRPVHASVCAVRGSIDARVAEVIWRKRRVIEEVMGEVTS